MSSRLVQREHFSSRARLDSQFLADAGKNFLLVAITSLISTLAALCITPNAIIVGGVGAATLGNLADNVVDVGSEVAETVVGALQQAGQTVSNTIDNAASAVSNFFGGLFGGG